MHILEESYYCTGCGACANACPMTCIYMEENEEGFLYPTVNSEKCMNCGLCKKVCPVLEDEKEKSNIKAYAVYNQERDVVLQSSSGGVFTAIARQLIQQGGAVYGAAFQKDLTVTHLRAETEEELAAFRGSKYVQSIIGNVYKRVKVDLNKRKKVLFSGTPCQVAALKKYLGKDYENLISVDIICHSVPSPKVWKQYVREWQEREKKKISEVVFRDKRNGWQQYYFCMKKEDGTEIAELGRENAYMKAFIQGLSTRESCYNCKFKGKKRMSDLTLGDFWGIENTYPEAYNPDGTSLVLVNSNKGQKILDALDNEVIVKNVDMRVALSQNNAYWSVAKPHKKREWFLKEVGQVPIEEMVRKILTPTLQERMKRLWYKSILWRVIRKLYRIVYER